MTAKANAKSGGSIGLPLVLGVKRRLSRRNDPREEKARAEFERQRPGVLNRDNWTCRGCGFASVKTNRAPAGGMEVHHIDDDHHNNLPDNLATLCPFCHMTFTLGRRGYRFDADLIYAPAINQWELNLLHHLIWGLERSVSLMEKGDPAAEGWRKAGLPDGFTAGLKKASESLQRVHYAGQTRLESQMSGVLPNIENMETVYGALQNLPPADYAKRDQIMAPLRLMPVFERFEASIDLWARHVWLAFYPPNHWADLVTSIQDIEKKARKG